MNIIDMDDLIPNNSTTSKSQRQKQQQGYILPPTKPKKQPKVLDNMTIAQLKAQRDSLYRGPKGHLIPFVKTRMDLAAFLIGLSVLMWVAGILVGVVLAR